MVVSELWNGVPVLKILPPTPEGRLIGYARVSREEQNSKLQIDDLVAAGVPRDAIYVDNASGRTMKRRGITAALKAAREGDMLVVWKLDRLTRSVRDMTILIEQFREQGVHLYTCVERFDITTPWGKAMALQAMIWAELEVETMSLRTKAGQAAGVAIGYSPGRPSSTTPDEKAEIITLMANKPKKHTARAWRTIVAARFKISEATVVNIVKNGRRAVTKQRRSLHEQARRRKQAG